MTNAAISRQKASYLVSAPPHTHQGREKERLLIFHANGYDSEAWDTRGTFAQLQMR